MAILAIFAMSLDLLVGVTGMVSLGHAGFLALGAYATAGATMLWGWPPAAAAGAVGGGGRADRHRRRRLRDSPQRRVLHHDHPRHRADVPRLLLQGARLRRRQRHGRHPALRSRRARARQRRSGGVRRPGGGGRGTGVPRAAAVAPLALRHDARPPSTRTRAASPRWAARYGATSWPRSPPPAGSPVSPVPSRRSTPASCRPTSPSGRCRARP